MPSNVVHNYFAKCVLSKLKPEIVKIIDTNLKAYLVGSQGPDLLFYLRFQGKPISELGTMIHSSFNALEVFKASGDYVKVNDNLTVFAFLLGQLCHYSLDANVHPYIYNREIDLPKFYNKGGAKYIHVIFESSLDYLCIRDNLKVNTRLYKGYKNLNCSPETRLDIAKYYNKVVAPIFGMEFPIDKAEKTIVLMRNFLRICDDMMNIRYIIIRGIELILRQPRNASAFIRPRKEHIKEDWMNLERVPFPKYRYEKILSSATVEEMIEKALDEAVILINNFYDYVISGKELNEALYYRNYSGERKIKGENL